MQRFREYVLSQLDVYYSDPGLTFLVAVLYMICEGGQVLESRVVWTWALRHNPSKAIDSPSLKLLEGISCGITEYMELIYSVFEDPKNRARYAINGERWTTGALVCLKYVCPAEPYPMPGEEITRAELRSNFLPYLLEKSEWSEDMASLLHSNAAAKELVQELVSSGRVKNEVISRYL